MNLTRRLTLAAVVSICLAGWGLNGVFASLNLSPGHLRLVRVLRTQTEQGDANLVQSGTRTERDADNTKQNSSAGKVEPAPEQSRRVYRELTAQEKEALLAGLAQRLRSMPVADFQRDQAALAAYAGLLEGSSGTMLAGDDGTVVLPENTVAEIEPNGDWASAQALSIGDTLAGTAVPFADFDVYSFEATAGQFVRVEAMPVGVEDYLNGGYAIVHLYDPDSALVGGGYYILYDMADSRIMWPGGSTVAASLKQDGTYHVVVEMYPGYIRWLDKGLIPEDSGNFENIAYRLTIDELETAAVNGLVRDDHGAPIAGATVDLWSEDGIGGAQVISGDDGRFNTLLPVGSWGAYIEGPLGGPYPSGQQQEMFKVTEGAVSVEFVLARGVVFSGRIMTNRGDVAPYVGMSLVGSDYRQYRWGQSDEDGYFSVAVFPDTFDIYLHPGYMYPPQSVIENVRIVSDTSYNIELDSGFRVSGRLLDGSGNPVPDTWMNFTNGGVYRSIYTSLEGEYTIYLPEGEYYTDVQPNYDRLIPAQFTGPYTVDRDLDLDIQLKSGGQLSGTVYDDRGNPVPSALVNVYAVVDVPDPDVTIDTVIKSDDGIIYADGNDGNGTPDLVDPADGVSGSQIYLPRYFQIYTNEQGEWRLALLAGEYAVDVTSPYPYPTQRVKLGNFTVQDGAVVDAGRVQFAYGVVFSGQVTVEGQPLAWSGFEMTTAYNDSIRYLNGMEIMPEPVVTRWVNTDENGEFSVQITPGTYDLLFNSGYGNISYPRQWVRGISLLGDTRMDIPLEAGRTISGRVVNEDGRGLPDSRLDFYAGDGTWQGMTTSVDDGEFSMVLAAGNYNLIVTPVKGYFTDATSYPISVPSTTQIEIVARSGVRVYGRVTASDGHPVGGVTVQLLPQYAQIQNKSVIQSRTIASLASHLADDGVSSDGNTSIYYPYPIPSPRDQNTTWTDYDGYWEMIVRPGVYDVFATPSMYDGFVNAFLPSVDCSAEKQINLVLEQTEIVFEGRVTDADGRPAPGTLVSLFDPENGGHISAFTDESGRFRLDLPMGDYEMFIEGPSGSDELPTSDRLKLDGDRQVLIQLGYGLLNDEQSGPKLPRAFALGQNVPNPFNPSTTISYALEEQAKVNLAVYDIRGRTVAVLVDRVQDEGDYNVQWDGTDRSGRQLASGIYIYRLQAGSYQMTRKMVLIK